MLLYIDVATWDESGKDIQASDFVCQLCAMFGIALPACSAGSTGTSWSCLDLYQILCNQQRKPDVKIWKGQMNDVY